MSANRLALTFAGGVLVGMMSGSALGVAIGLRVGLGAAEPEVASYRQAGDTLTRGIQECTATLTDHHEKYHALNRELRHNLETTTASLEQANGALRLANQTSASCIASLERLVSR